MSYRLVITKTAARHMGLLKAAGLSSKADALLQLIAENPFAMPPRYEKLVGDMAGAYSRRINIKHRLVYQVYEMEHVIKIVSMWTHYGDN